MRGLIPFMVLIMLLFLIPCGCGGEGLTGELSETLDNASGSINTLLFTCITADGDRTYREEADIRFPADFLYRFYDISGGQSRLINVVAQSGNDVFRAQAVYDQSGEITSVEIEMISNVPPIRCSGLYLGLYHMIGNTDYFQSILALVQGGDLEIKGSEELEGRQAYYLKSAPDRNPAIELWLDRETGLPLQKKLLLGEGREVVFRYEGVRENTEYEGEPFPPEAAALFGVPPEKLAESERDEGCSQLDINNAESVLGFELLVPELSGFELAEVLWRDPGDSGLEAGEGALDFPEGFREAYLVLRRGPSEVEIRETPHDPDFDYHTMSMGALTGAYLSCREVWGEDTGNAEYTAALDCQELYFNAGDVDVLVTGDLSRAEFESLAVQMQGLSGSQP